ncbi:MAG: glycosyltransferase family 9 protein [Deltaproteobacteria bacterium]|nr:glycosyltransferase family 9 protein [Deltaproteobacteria bacterium]
MSGKSILIIHLSRLGDAIQSLPAVRLLKEENPGGTITYLGIENFCTLLKGNPWIDRLVTAPWQEIRGIMGEKRAGDTGALDRFFQGIPELGERYDLLVNLTHDWSSSYLSERIDAAEKRGRIFSANNEIVVSGNWGKYLFAVARNRKDNLLNLVDLYMGMAGVRHRPVVDFLPTDPQKDLACISRLKELGVDRDRRIIGLQPGANLAARRWPVEHFVKLGEALIDAFDARIVLFGSPGERELAEAFGRIAPFPFVDLVGRTTLQELPSFFRGIDLLVSNDTGPMHIASAVGTKVVGLFMSVAFSGITGPYGAGHVVVQSDYPCFPCIDTTVCCNPLCREGITPEAVLHGVRMALEPDVAGPDRDVESGLYRSSFRDDGTMRYELIGGRTDRFLPWLTSFTHTKATIGQALWNRWLGINDRPSGARFGGSGGEYDDIIADFQKACSSYGEIYRRGIKTCRRILDEFSKKKPNIGLIQGMADRLSRGEEEIRDLEGPLPIFKEIHELCMSETEICNFPKLAREFLKAYETMSGTVRSLEAALQEISPPALRL